MAKETLRLMAQQIRDRDEPFDAVYIIPTFNSFDLTLNLDEFSEKFLMEAADTMMNRHVPVNRARLDLPTHVQGARFSWMGISLRVLSAHHPMLDEMKYRMDAIYEPEPISA